MYLCDGHIQKSVLRIYPVTVPYIFGGGHSRLENIDRCHSLRSLLPPPAALPSLPQRATLVGLITWDGRCEACCHNQKENPIQMDGVFFLVAGGGLEPPTSGL